MHKKHGKNDSNDDAFSDDEIDNDFDDDLSKLSSNDSINEKTLREDFININADLEPKLNTKSFNDGIQQLPETLSVNNLSNTTDAALTTQILENKYYNSNVFIESNDQTNNKKYHCSNKSFNAISTSSSSVNMPSYSYEQQSSTFQSSLIKTFNITPATTMSDLNSSYSYNSQNDDNNNRVYTNEIKPNVMSTVKLSHDNTYAKNYNSNEWYETQYRNTYDYNTVASTNRNNHYYGRNEFYDSNQYHHYYHTNNSLYNQTSNNNQQQHLNNIQQSNGLANTCNYDQTQSIVYQKL